MTETTTAKAPRNTAGAIAKAAGKAATPAPAKSEKATMQAYINRMRPEIIKALPAHIPAERFIRTLLTAISTTPKLAECYPPSYLAAMMECAQNGLEANTALGLAYLIPFYNNRERRYECNFVLGYKGYLDLIYRSGQVLSVQVHPVYENDTFTYELGLHPDLKHIPARTDRGEITDYYAVINLRDGGYIFEVMSVEDIRSHAEKYSKAAGAASSPWKTNFDSMACKTVLKRAMKYAPVSASVMRQIAADETVKTEISADMTEVAGSYILDESTGEVVADAPQEAEHQDDKQELNNE